MKTSIRCATAVLAALTIPAGWVMAQNKQVKKQQVEKQQVEKQSVEKQVEKKQVEKQVENQDVEMLSRSIRQKYASGQDEGLNMVVYKAEAGELIPIDPGGHTFKKGDAIKIEFQSNFDGYVYFVNVSPTGDKAVFYPDMRFKDNNNIIRARQKYVLPKEQIFEFDEDERGVEVIQVIMSHQPIAFLEDAVRNADGVLGNTASGAVSELAGLDTDRTGFVTENTTKVLPDQGEGAVLSRKIRLAPPRDRDKQGAVVTVPDKLNPGEVAIFEIRLRRG